MKPRRSGLTMVELLVVVGIIALLTGMLIPAVTAVKKIAREAKQKAQFTAIELGLEAFKSDFGDYPKSDPYTWTRNEPTTKVENTSGAMKLSEAMLGWDLLGVHPDTSWRADGTNEWDYQVGSTTYAPGQYKFYDQTNATDVQKRKGRYIEMDVANPFQLGKTAVHDGAFNLTNEGEYLKAADCYFLGDVFGKGAEVVLSNGTRTRSGRPILYYRANPANKFVDLTANSAYDYKDNHRLLLVIEDDDTTRMGTPRGTSSGAWNPLVMGASAFMPYVKDPRTPTTLNQVVPYRPDSYILVSAGADGLYGTSDDIRNFGK